MQLYQRFALSLQEETPLVKAAQLGHVSVTEALLLAKANVDALVIVSYKIAFNPTFNESKYGP